MNVKVLIAAGGAVLLLGAGVATYVFWPAGDQQVVKKLTPKQKAAAALQAKEAKKRNKQIGRLVRELGDTQDGIAYGISGALEKQGVLLGELVDAFVKADADKWQHPPKEEDILIYALSGGEPEILRRYAVTKLGPDDPPPAKKDGHGEKKGGGHGEAEKSGHGGGGQADAGHGDKAHGDKAQGEKGGHDGGGHEEKKSGHGEAKSDKPEEGGILKGILRYVYLRKDEAKAILEPVGPWSLDPTLSGLFSLAKASLYSGAEAKSAITLLEAARLASPNTAVEEAAMRRQIPLLLADKRAPEAVQLFTNYVMRFGNSAYAPRFFEDFAGAFASMDTVDDGKAVGALAERLEETNEERSADVLLGIARAQLKFGRLKAPNAAATKVLSMIDISDAQKQRAKLYLAASLAPTEKAADAMAALEGLKQADLDEDDAAIMDVARNVASVVSGQPDGQAKPGDKDKDKTLDIQKSAKDTLSKANDLLSKTEPLTKTGAP